MAKKRAMVDATLNVGNLSARFTQDVEDMNLEPDNVGGKNPEELKQNSKPKASSKKPATKKQILLWYRNEATDKSGCGQTDERTIWD